MSLFQALKQASQAFVEQRRSLRHRVQCTGWIGVGDGTQMRNCTLLDISEGGARILVSSPAQLPEEVSLVLANEVAISRRCKIIWRSNDQIGVSYLEHSGTATP